MSRFHTSLFLLTLAAAGCGSASEGTTPSTLDGDITLHSDAGVTPSVDGAAGDSSTGGKGMGGSDNVAVGGSSSIAGTASVGAGGAGGTVGGTAGAAGTAGSSQGGTGGSAQGGTGGQGATGGSAQGGTGGSITPPPPACTFDVDHVGSGSRCTHLLFETCTLDGNEVAQYSSTQCGTDPDIGLNCDESGGCFGECTNGDVRCSGETAEACVSGAWETTEVCGFQCVNGACEGACTPGDIHCDGASVVTCGGDFHYGSPAACPGDVNATATCSGVGECGMACTPGFDDCSGAPGCETDLSSVDSCGGCGIVCPGATNATRTCNGGVCGLTPIACSSGTANCTGDFACETNTASDPLNCGGCGVRCYGTCDAGVCDVETVTDSAGDYTVSYTVDLVADGGHVYWWKSDGSNNTILRAPKSGGSPETLATFSDAAVAPSDNALLVDNAQVYWATRSGVFRKPLAGGAVQTLSNQGAASLVIDDGKLYWNNASTTNLPSCYVQFYLNQTSFLNCNNSAVVTFYAVDLSTLVQTSWQTTQFEFSHVLGVQGNELFVALFHGSSTSLGHANYATSIQVLNAATGAYLRTVTDLLRIDGFGWGLGVYFGQAVFTGSSVTFTTENGILQASTTSYGETSQVTGQSPPSTPEAMAVDASHVYVAHPGSVSRISRSTLATEPVSSTPGSTTSKVAVDASYVYWTADVSGGQTVILRASK